MYEYIWFAGGWKHFKPFLPLLKFLFLPALLQNMIGVASNFRIQHAKWTKPSTKLSDAAFYKLLSSQIFSLLVVWRYLPAFYWQFNHFRKKSKWPPWYTQEPGGIWFMKNLKSKISRKTPFKVAFPRLILLLILLTLFSSHCLLLFQLFFLSLHPQTSLSLYSLTVLPLTF